MRSFLAISQLLLTTLFFSTSANAMERRLHIDFDKVTNADAQRLCNQTCPDNDKDGAPDAICLIGKIVETGDCTVQGLPGAAGTAPNAFSQVLPFGDGMAVFPIDTKVQDVTGTAKRIQGTVAAITHQFDVDQQGNPVDLGEPYTFSQGFTLIPNILQEFFAPVPVPYHDVWATADVEELKAEYDASGLAKTYGPFRSNEAVDDFGRPLGASTVPSDASIPGPNGDVTLPQWFLLQETAAFKAEMQDSFTLSDGTTFNASGYFLGKKGYILCRCFYDQLQFPTSTGGFGLGGCNHCQYLIVWQDDDANSK